MSFFFGDGTKINCFFLGHQNNFFEMNPTTRERLQSFDENDKKRIAAWLSEEDISLEKPLLKKLKEATQKEWDRTNKILYVLYYASEGYYDDPNGFFIRIDFDTMVDGKLSDEDTEKCNWLQKVLDYNISYDLAEEIFELKVSKQSRAESELTWLEGRMGQYMLEKLTMNFSKLPKLDILKKRAKQLGLPYGQNDNDDDDDDDDPVYPRIRDYEELLKPVEE